MAIGEKREYLMPERKLSLAELLQREGLFKVMEDPKDFFELKSGRRAPHYLDLRQGISDPGVLTVIANTFGAMMEAQADFEGETVRDKLVQSRYSHVVGTPEAVTSYAAVTAERFGISLLQPRVNMEKSAGNKTPILGRYEAGDKVAALDDVITDGQSKIDTIQALGALGIDVIDYFVIVDREEGGVSQVQEATGLTVTPAVGVSGMVKMLHEAGSLNRTQFDNVAEYMGQYGDPSARGAFGLDE